MIEIQIFNVETCNKILNYRSDHCIRDLYNNKNEFMFEAKYLRESVKLDLDEGTSLGTNPSDDLESSLKIHTALKSLDLVAANDKRIWVTLSHTLFYQYTINRWNINNNTSNDTIKDRFYFEGTSLRPRNQNSIARLWWSAQVTYDETKPDPYSLTKILWEKQDFYQNLLDRKYSIYGETLKGFLNFYVKNKNLDLKVDMRKLFRGLNAFGGVRILSLLNEREIQDQLENLCNFYNIEFNKLNGSK